MELSQIIINKKGKVEDTFSSLTNHLQKIISKVENLINN